MSASPLVEYIRGYNNGAAVAFGLMGMAEAIRARQPFTTYGEGFRNGLVAAGVTDVLVSTATPDDECAECAGTGRFGFRDDDECTSCHGSGRVHQ